MLELLERADSVSSELREVLKENPRVWSAVNGASLEMDEFWSRAATRLEFGQQPPSPYEDFVAWDLWRALEGRAPLPADWEPPGWDVYAKANGWPKPKKAPSPFRARVWLNHPLPSVALPTAVKDIPITYEVRERIVAADVASYFRGFASSDLSVGKAEPRPTAGTLGGYLRSDDGITYLVSCAHVLGPPGTAVFAPGPFENRGRELCATVRESIEPPIGAAHDPCGVIAPDTPLDIAAAEILPNWLGRLPRRGLAKIVRPALRMVNHQPVFFEGKVSGYVEAEVSPSLGLWAQITFPDETVRCMGKIFEIVRPMGKVGSVAQQGDSGAWVCDRAGEVVCWNGIIVGVRPDRAYCMFAETAKIALDKALGTTHLA